MADRRRSARRHLRPTVQSAFLVTAALLHASILHAQSSPTVEVSAVYWRPGGSLVTSSDAPGVPGTPIDLHGDLGVTDRGFPAVALAVRPAARHRLRFEYIPIRYEANTTITRDLVFSGGTYRRGDTVASTFSWDAVNAGYEYDFLLRAHASIGVLVEWKSTVVDQRLTSAIEDRSRRTSVPAPAIGLALRATISPRVSVFGELRGFAVPDGQNGHYGGRYVDLDGGGTIAITRHLGFRGGVRWLDIRHLGESDTARFSLPGAYVGVVVSR